MSRSLPRKPATSRTWTIALALALALALTLVAAPPAASHAQTEAPRDRPTGKSAARPADNAPAARIDLNRAPAEQLESLPGIGPAHAREIIAARPFRSIDDLDRVKGLTRARIAALRDHVTVSEPAPTPPTPSPATTKAAPTPAPATTTRAAPKSGRVAARPASARPLNLNTASKEELDALPGIGPVKAQAIVDHRQTQPFKSREDVMKVKGIKAGEFAKIKDLIAVE